MVPATLLIGSGGLLGRAMASAQNRRGELVVTVEGVPWHEPQEARARLRDAAASIVSSSAGWRVLWCAGAGVTGTSPERFAAEVRQLEWFLDDLEAVRGSGPGGFLLASSAGGVYGGSQGVPFTESTEPVALSPYGEAKLAQEALVRAAAERGGYRTLVARFANLYGPGQNLDKRQGLISHLCAAAITRRPASIYVPLDTLRDYVFVDDAAELALEALAAVQLGEEPVMTKIIASQRATTVAALIHSVRSLSRTGLPIVLGASSLAAMQARDLRLRSTVMTEVDDRALTPLAEGIRRTFADLLYRVTALPRRAALS